nr:MAG: chemotaxis protein CheR [Bacillota bacterium]
MNLPGYPVFRRTVLELTGIDLDLYKGTQLERRLQALLRRVGVPDLVRYARMLREDSQRVQEFRDFLTINVTEFFRNPDKFRELKESILPDLLARSPRLRIWSAGCSTGAEPYSVAIILDELGAASRAEILASDIDERALDQARLGIYSEREMKEVDPVRRRRYFVPTGDGWQVVPAIRRRVRFWAMNLLADPFPEACDLILCRNVVIYFSEEAKDQLYRRFRAALKPGGVLFVGGTESLLRARELGFAPITPFFYRAIPGEPPGAGVGAGVTKGR